MSTDINTFPVKPIGHVSGATKQLVFQTPRGRVVMGFYQGFEATTDGECTSGQRRLLNYNEAVAYATEGTLPDGFADRPTVCGGYKKDAAKADFKRRNKLDDLFATEVQVVALVNPTLAAAAAPVQEIKPVVSVVSAEDRVEKLEASVASLTANLAALVAALSAKQ